MQKILLDTNIYDDIIKDSEYLQLLERAEHDDLIEVIATQFQIDQIHRISFEPKKEQMLRLVDTKGTVTTAGCFDDLSKEGWYRVGFEKEIIHFMGNKKPNNKNKADALIASTALIEDCIFVTNDKSLKNKYPQERVMNSSDFKEHLKNVIKKE